MEGQRSDRGRLRVGVFVAGALAPAWIAGLLDDLVSSATMELGELMIAAPSGGGGVASRRPSATERTIARCDQLLFGRRVREVAVNDLRRWADAHGVEIMTPAAGGTGRDPDAPGRAGHLDIVLDLTGSDTGTSTGVELETWVLTGVPLQAGAADMDLVRTIADVVSGSQVTTFELEVRRPGRHEAEIRDVAVCPVHPTSPALTHEYLAASARQLVIERLTAAAEGIEPAAADPAGAGGRVEEADVPTAAPPVRQAPRSVAETRHPGPLAVAAFLARTTGRQVRRALVEKQWHLLVGTQPADRPVPAPSHLRPLDPGPGRYWADPFVVVHDGLTHVFFEEFVYDTKRGRISVMTLDREGRPGAKSVALELDGHLSYPCVFTHEGRLFMVPESAGARTVDLYECIDMPTGWVYRRTLLSGVPLVDASVVKWGDLWWMFASLKKPAGLRTAELLVLYVSEDPVTGTWRRHAASPLLADVTNARPAGAPFAVGDRLFRPAQDGAGDYGRAITLNEVLTLTPERYAERRVGTLQPDWARGLAGTHTLNRAGDVIVMDVCRYVLRDPRRPRAESMME